MKKIIFFGVTLLVAILAIACNKECVCTKSVTTTVATDSVPTTTNTQDVYHGGNIYDKTECEALNGSDSTSTTVTTFTCSWEKKSK